MRWQELNSKESGGYPMWDLIDHKGNWLLSIFQYNGTWRISLSSRMSFLFDLNYQYQSLDKFKGLIEKTIQEWALGLQNIID